MADLEVQRWGTDVTLVPLTPAAREYVDEYRQMYGRAAVTIDPRGIYCERSRGFGYVRGGLETIRGEGFSFVRNAATAAGR